MGNCTAAVNPSAEMGLGKTVTSLLAARGFQRAYGLKVLVLSPACVAKNWAKEALGVGVTIEVLSWAKIPYPPAEPLRPYR